MSSKLHEQIAERFIKAVRKSFEPCPLIGPKWLQEYPKGHPADFRFVGLPKLAKAAGRSIERTQQIFMKNLSLNGLDVDVKIVEGRYVDLNIKGKPRPDQKPKPAAAKKAVAKKPAAKKAAAKKTTKPKAKKNPSKN
ncbi:MAG: hypothetical protein KAR11_07690 [Phycisphaerae bacterium]|nr:hypothetical protein [Phycisphaerae bacterium]